MVYTNYEEFPLVLRVKDVANILDVGIGIVYQLVRSGEIPSKRIGARGIIRIAKADLIRYIEGDIPKVS